MQNFKFETVFSFIEPNKERFTVNLPYEVKRYKDERIDQDIAFIDVSNNTRVSKYVFYAGAILKEKQDSNDTNDLSRILLSKKYFEITDSEQQDFIKLHEIGHVSLNHKTPRTLENEIAADEYSISITKNYHAALTLLETALKEVRLDETKNELIARINAISSERRKVL